MRHDPSDSEDSSSNTPSNELPDNSVIKLPDERTVLRDAVAVLRAFAQRSDGSFVELILQFEWEELIGILACMAGMLNTVFDLTAQRQGLDMEYIYHQILRGADEEI